MYGGTVLHCTAQNITVRGTDLYCMLNEVFCIMLPIDKNMTPNSRVLDLFSYKECISDYILSPLQKNILIYFKAVGNFYSESVFIERAQKCKDRWGKKVNECVVKSPTLVQTNVFVN